jgi:hypothetical protein
MVSASLPPGLPALLERIHTQLLPELQIHCPDPHDPVRVRHLPHPWRTLGCGNYAAVLQHPHHPDLVVKVYGPGRPGLEQEAEVYRLIGTNPAFSQCFRVGACFLVLRRLRSPRWACERRGRCWMACAGATACGGVCAKPLRRPHEMMALSPTTTVTASEAQLSTAVRTSR